MTADTTLILGILFVCLMLAYVMYRIGQREGAAAERIKLYGNTLPRYENPPPPPPKKGSVPKMPNHPPMPELSKHKLRGPKFRIWDRERASWYRPVFQAYEGKLHELLLTTEGELCRRGMDGFTHESQFPNRYVVQVFARIQDIKGVDIYEGDIVKDRFGRIMEVKRWNYRLCWVAIKETNFHHADLYDWVERDENGDLTGMALAEVIGNRYENPELFTELNTKEGK